MNLVDKLRAIEYFFDLDMLHLSKALGVTISELDSFDEVTIANHKPRIDRLCSICESAMAHADFQDIRYAEYLSRKMPGMRDSLLNLLKEKELKCGQIMRAVEIISHVHKFKKHV